MEYDDVVRDNGGLIATAVIFLNALSIPPSCFCCYMIGNSVSTMIPKFSRLASSLAAAVPASGFR